MSTQLFEESMEVFEERFELPRPVNRTRDAVVFLAGAEACHTLMHAWIAVSGLLPITLPLLTLTPGLNAFAIVANGLITAGLVYWARRLER